MAMGSFAQGFRFAITLILNMTLQKLGVLKHQLLGSCAESK